MTARHVFLTGARQAGKSTIIRTHLAQTGLTADGFITYWDDTSTRLFLAPFDIPSQGRVVARRPASRPDGRPASVHSDPAVFDTYGAAIVANSGRRDVIVMDELGFLESSAPAFQAAVMACLDQTTPVLGVLRARSTPFLDVVRNHAGVCVYDVTAANRDEVAACLLAR